MMDSSLDSEYEVVTEGASAPEISVLVPTFNQATLVRESLISIFEQRGIACEILVSDDHSTDGTCDVVEQFVRSWRDRPQFAHRVLLRKGSHRLGRDHVPHLLKGASCDLVMQAHGDDIAHPDRAATLVGAMKSSGATMVGSSMTTVDEAGRVVDDSDAKSGSTRLLGWREVVDGEPWLLGANQCWDRRKVQIFRPLAVEWAPTSHDRIVSLRAWLTGGVAKVEVPLLRRRMHSGNWSHFTDDVRSMESSAYTMALQRLMKIEVMREDLHLMLMAPTMGVAELSEIGDYLDSVRGTTLEELRRAYGALIQMGRLQLWATEEEMKLANANRLYASLKRKVARRVPIERASGLILRMMARRARS